jgi:hypothetical protein
MRKYLNYTDEDIIKYAKEVKTLGALLRALGLRVAGGNYINMRLKLQQLSVDTSHWTGQGWSKGQQKLDWSDYKRVGHLKKHLIKEKGHACEWCEKETWRGIPITLEVDHIDGNRTNNELDNLRLLCPNCHSQTDTWRGRKNRTP